MSLALILAVALMASPSQLDLVTPRPAAQADPDLRARVLTQPQLQLRPPEPQRPAADDGDRWGWRPRDTALEAAYGLTALGDYLQTRRITRDGRELNPIIGKHGRSMRPEVYFPLTTALHVGAMRLLPAPWRNIAQGLSIGFEGGAVGHNATLGYGLKF